MNETNKLLYKKLNMKKIIKNYYLFYDKENYNIDFDSFNNIYMYGGKKKKNYQDQKHQII